MILRLKKKGSMRDAKKAPVENIARVMDIFEALIAAKKVIQWSAIIIPASENLMRHLKVICKLYLLKIRNKKVTTINFNSISF